MVYCIHHRHDTSLSIHLSGHFSPYFPSPQYPSAIKGLTFDPNFAIRGLHCDIKNGYLMKIDAYNHIQLTSVHRWVVDGLSLLQYRQKSILDKHFPKPSYMYITDGGIADAVKVAMSSM